MTTFADQLFQYGGVPVASATALARNAGRVVFVDGTYGSDGNSGKTVKRAYATIQKGVTAAGESGTVFVLPKLITDLTGDPANYAETVIIPATHMNLTIMGVSHGRTQGGLPQMKKGSGSTAHITVRAAGCRILNMGINGFGSTGAGILLDDDNSAKTAFGTTIMGCHLKNVAPSATLASAGGAITWSAAGNAWQVRIEGNTFYKNTSDVCLLGTTNTSPQDVVIENNTFSGPGASVSCQLFLTGAGSGMNGVTVHNNRFLAMPTAGGTNRVVDMTGCVGIFSNNSIFTASKTFGATGSGGLIPTTVGICGNYQDGALIART